MFGAVSGNLLKEEAVAPAAADDTMLIINGKTDLKELFEVQRSCGDAY